MTDVTYETLSTTLSSLVKSRLNSLSDLTFSVVEDGLVATEEITEATVAWNGAALVASGERCEVSQTSSVAFGRPHGEASLTSFCAK